MQTPWLSAFLHDPHMIRPAAQLRMPRFHFGKDEKASFKEAGRAGQLLCRAGSGAIPVSVDSRADSGLSRGAEKGPSRLPRGGLDDDDEQGLTVPSVSCDRAVQAQRGGSGGERARTCGWSLRGSSLSYLEAWIANPRRMLPFTAMPQNIKPHGDIQIPVPKTFENKPIDMVRAVRDTLLNYVNAVELQLASSSAAPAPAGGSAAAGTPVKAPGSAP